MTTTTIHSLADEYKQLQTTFPLLNIISKTKDFITASYERQRVPIPRYTRVKVTLTLPSSYPNEPPAIHVDSMFKGLSKKIESEMKRQCECLKEDWGQIVACFRFLIHFIDTNRFIPCWRELKLVAEMVQKEARISKSIENNDKKNVSSISFDEIQGKIRIKLCHNEYFYTLAIVIDEGYPSTMTIANWGKACDIRVIKTNFPPKIEMMMTAQAKDLVRKMQDGLSSDHALSQSNPIKEPKDFRKQAGKDIEVRLTQGVLKGLKQDTETLKKVNELREIDSATLSFNAKAKAHASKDRKDARRNIRKITASEISNDIESEEREKQWQIEEKARLAGYDSSQFDGSNPQPSLQTLVQFLVGRIWKLPEEKCPACSKLVLPLNPKILQSIYQKADNVTDEKMKKERAKCKKKRPVRTFCGCWYHCKLFDLIWCDLFILLA